MVDDEGIARDGLCALLQREDELHVDGAFSSGREAVRNRGDLRPERRDHRLSDRHENWPAAIAHVKRRWPSARVLVLSGSRDGQVIEAARRAGADGYVLRNDRRDELFEAIHALANGKHYISSPCSSCRARQPTALAHAPRRTDSAGMLDQP